MPYSGLPRVGGITERFKNNVKNQHTNGDNKVSILITSRKAIYFCSRRKTNNEKQ